MKRIPILEYEKIIREKVQDKPIFCDYCKKEIKRKKFNIGWKPPERLKDSKSFPRTFWTNLRYVRFYHSSCFERKISKLLKKPINKC